MIAISLNATKLSPLDGSLGGQPAVVAPDLWESGTDPTELMGRTSCLGGSETVGILYCSHVFFFFPSVLFTFKGVNGVSSGPLAHHIAVLA